MVTCTGHIGIHEGADGRTDVRMYVRTDVHDVMAIKPNFLTSMEQRRLLSDWLLKIVVSSFPTARCDVNKDGFRSGDFNLCFFDRSIYLLPVEGGHLNLK